MSKWSLKIKGHKNSPKFLAACKELETFNIWKDAECKIIDEFRLDELVRTNSIYGINKHWIIGKGEVGVIALTQFNEYSTTWNEMDDCLKEFCKGWEACEKYQVDLKDFQNSLTLSNEKKGGS